jgi:hypothetical protein
VIHPTVRAQVNLDAAGAKLATVEQDERVAKIRSVTVTPGSTVDDFQGNTVNRFETGRHRSPVPGGAERDFGNAGRFAHLCLGDGAVGAGSGRS